MVKNYKQLIRIIIQKKNDYRMMNAEFSWKCKENFSIADTVSIGSRKKNRGRQKK